MKGGKSGTGCLTSLEGMKEGVCVELKAVEVSPRSFSFIELIH